MYRYEYVQLYIIKIALKYFEYNSIIEMYKIYYVVEQYAQQLCGQNGVYYLFTIVLVFRLV